MPAVATRNQGKSMFVKEMLNDDPLANTEAVNAAWRAAGMSGTISSSLISNVRTRLRLSGKLPRKRRRRTRTAGAADAGAAGPVTGRRRGRPRRQAGPGGNGEAPVMSRGRERELMSLEVEIDRLLMTVVETGALPEVENALRKVRRQLYAGLLQQS
jgi:hypothetical protein